MRYYSGSYASGNKEMSGPFVSLSRCGIPTIIPRHHRHVIMKGGDRADSLVRLYLSWFSVCRIIKLAKPVGRHTFKSIVEPIKDINRVKVVMAGLKEKWKRLSRMYLPWIKRIPLVKGFQFVPSWKSVPNEETVLFRVTSRKGFL